MGFFFWLGLLITQAVVAVRVLMTSRHEKFQLGVYAACSRLIALVPLGLMLMAVYFPGLAPLPWRGFLALAALGVMPLGSFVAIWKSYQRMQNVPAADEAQAGRPFNAWLPIAIVDAIMVVIALATLLLLRPRHLSALFIRIVYI